MIALIAQLRAASRCCWSSTTWTRCSAWPTASRCWSGGRMIATRRPPTIRREREVKRAYLGKSDAVSASVLLDVRGLRGRLRHESGAVRPRLRCAGRSGHAARPQRHGQDHDGALDAGHHAGRGRRDRASRGERIEAMRARPHRAPGHGAGARGPADLSQSERAREPESRSRDAMREARRPGQPERVLELFPRLAERADHMGNQLSGGEQQMLAIGRALVTNPDLLILDEATEGLAPLVREEIWRASRSLRAAGQTILVIDKYVRAADCRWPTATPSSSAAASRGAAARPRWRPTAACGTAISACDRSRAARAGRTNKRAARSSGS